MSLRLLPVLWLMGCSTVPLEELAAPAVAPPAVLGLTVDPLVAGYAGELVVTGATPGALVYFGFSPGGPGAGPCPPGLGGCIGLSSPMIAGTARANSNGRARTSLTIPGFVMAPQVWFQAVELGGNPGLSVVVAAPILRPNGDEDGDGASNGAEAAAGSNPTVVDTDGGGVGDGDELATGTDPTSDGDDALYDLQSATVVLDIVLDFQGFSAVLACATLGYCDCRIRYRGTGTRSDAFDTAVQFDGTWEKRIDTCGAAIDFSSVVWVPGTGRAYHTAIFGPDAATLDAWVISADPNNLDPQPDPVTAEQGYVGDLAAPWDGVSDIIFQVSSTFDDSGVTVETTIDGSITWN